MAANSELKIKINSANLVRYKKFILHVKWRNESLAKLYTFENEHELPKTEEEIKYLKESIDEEFKKRLSMDVIRHHSNSSIGLYKLDVFMEIANNYKHIK